MKRAISYHKIFIYLITLLVSSFLLVFSNVTSYAATNNGGWLGIGIKEMTPSGQKNKGMEEITGILVTSVEPNSPADKAGLKDDDVVLEYDGKTVKYLDEFIELVRKTEPDTKVTLTILRDGEKLTKEVIIGKKDPHSIEAQFPERHKVIIHKSSPWIGVHIQDIDQDLADYFKVDENAGVLITEVVDESPAAKAGLKSGDVITKIGDEELHNIKDLHSALREYDDGDEVVLKIVRKGKQKDFTVKLEARERSKVKIIKKKIMDDKDIEDLEDIEIDIDIDIDDILDNVDKTIEKIFDDIGI